MSWIRTAIAVGIVAVAASGTFARTDGGDLASLQGTWWTKTEAPVLVKSKRPSKPIYSITVLVIEGNKMKMTLATPDGKTHKFDSEFVLEESTNPKQFDDAKESVLGKTLAIYELDGDTLKMCSGGPGQPRPKQFVGSSTGLPRLVTYTRGLPPEGMPATREARKTSRFPAQFKARATVVEVDKHHNVLLRFEDGRELQVNSQIDSAYDASGAKIKDAHSIKKAGNVLDVFVTGKMVKGEESYTFIEARLVKGDLIANEAPRAKKAAPEPLVLQSGVVTQLTVWRATIDVDGTLVHVGRHHPAAKAYDSNGELMAKGSAERMLKVGNKVKIFVNKKLPRQAYPTLREIHLVEGSLADPGEK
jgi:uncharacterized protein (TIGR03067 family)